MVSFRNNLLFFLKGAHRRTGDGQVFEVSRVIRHRSFSMQYLRHDVAVLKLARPATLGGKINTICLPSHGSRVSQGTKCYVTGEIVIIMHFLSRLSCQCKVSLGRIQFEKDTCLITSKKPGFVLMF